MERLPEQVFFSDPALDRAVGMVMALAAELYVTRDRLRALERLLEANGSLEPGALDRYEPAPAEAAALRAERDAFVRGILDNLLGQQASKGAAPAPSGT